jgi:hypothetical protein
VAEKQAGSEDIQKHLRQLAQTADSEPSESSGPTNSCRGEPASRVRSSLVEEMMHARSVAASQSVSWLGCGE